MEDKTAGIFENGKVGWLSPDAEFETCPEYGHTEKAAEIYERLNLHDEIKNFDSAIMRRGWIKITYSTFMEYGYRFFGKRLSATEAQKRALREFFERWGNFIAPGGYGDLYEFGVISDEERIKNRGYGG